MVGALDYESAQFGATVSGYYGGADQDLVLDAMDEMVSVSNWILKHCSWET